MRFSVLIVLIWILFGVISSYLANQRGRDPYLWFVIGFMLGPFAILLVLLLRRVEHQQTLSRDVKPVELLLPEDHKDPSPLVKSWFFLDQAGQQHGPISFDALKKEWEENAIDAATFVWCEGMEKWLRIDEIPELKQKLQS